MLKDQKENITKIGEQDKGVEKKFDVIGDLSQWRTDPDYMKAAGTKKHITRIPNKKPDKQQFIRVHPEPEYHFPACIIEYDETREKYIVLPEVAQELAGEVKSVVLYPYITRSEDVFLWPIKSLVDLYMANPWVETAHQCALIAIKKWIRIVSNQATRSYEIIEPENTIPDPEWPNLSMEEILNIAFRDKIVTDLDHEIIKKLRGADI